MSRAEEGKYQWPAKDELYYSISYKNYNSISVGVAAQVCTEICMVGNSFMGRSVGIHERVLERTRASLQTI
jgi:hypothetical protein